MFFATHTPISPRPPHLNPSFRQNPRIPSTSDLKKPLAIIARPLAPHAVFSRCHPSSPQNPPPTFLPAGLSPPPLPAPPPPRTSSRKPLVIIARPLVPHVVFSRWHLSLPQNPPPTFLPAGLFPPPLPAPPPPREEAFISGLLHGDSMAQW